MNPRTPVADLHLQGSPNLKRALDRGAEKPLAKRAELEQMFEEVTARRSEALADVKANGMVMLQDKYSARGELYRVRIVNPSLVIAQKCEGQLASLARLLAQGPATAEPSKEMSDDSDSFGRLIAESAEDVN